MFQNPYASLMPQSMSMQNQAYNQTFPQLNQINNSQQNLIRVNGIDGAKAYQMPPNSTVALFDGNEDVMYIKSTDGAGFGNIRMFQFTEIQNNQTQSQVVVDYVSREEFESLKKEVEDYGKQFVQTSTAKSTRTSKQSDNIES